MNLDYYRQDSRLPFPQSIATALRAFRNHQIPVEPVLFRAGSADTMFQQPLNIPLIKEVLAASRLDAEVNGKVAALLFSYVGDTDQEISDFAAQHLAKLEERYQKEIRATETAFEQDPRLAGNLARLYLDFAEIEQYNPTLQRFYLQKGREIAESAWKTAGPVGTEERIPGKPVEDAVESDSSLALLRVSFALALRDLDEAERCFADGVDAAGIDKKFHGLVMAAEIAFQRRDIDGVVTIAAKIAAAGAGPGERLPEPVQELIHQWRVDSGTDE